TRPPGSGPCAPPQRSSAPSESPLGSRMPPPSTRPGSNLTPSITFSRCATERETTTTRNPSSAMRSSPRSSQREEAC
ncbi:unnamed protein product, partial [Rangifer tarandus platyrhynchus]